MTYFGMKLAQSGAAVVVKAIKESRFGLVEKQAGSLTHKDDLYYQQIFVEDVEKGVN